MTPEATQAFVTAGKVGVSFNEGKVKPKDDVEKAMFLCADDFHNSKQGRNNVLLFVEAMRHDFGKMYYPLVVDGHVKFKDPKSKKTFALAWQEFLSRVNGYMLAKYGKKNGKMYLQRRLLVVNKSGNFK